MYWVHSLPALGFSNSEESMVTKIKALERAYQLPYRQEVNVPAYLHIL